MSIEIGTPILCDYTSSSLGLRLDRYCPIGYHRTDPTLCHVGVLAFKSSEAIRENVFVEARALEGENPAEVILAALVAELELPDAVKYDGWKSPMMQEPREAK